MKKKNNLHLKKQHKNAPATFENYKKKKKKKKKSKKEKKNSRTKIT